MQVALGSLIESTATIVNTAQESSVISTAGLSLCGILMPPTFTGTALTFEACATLGGTYVPVYNSAGQVSYTVAAARYIAIDPKDFQGILFLKIKSGSAEGGARSLLCSMKGI